MTRGSVCQYSCVHASTSLLKFACFWLRSPHAKSSDDSAQVVASSTRQVVLQRLHGAIARQYNSICANTGLHAAPSNAPVSSVRPQQINRFSQLFIQSLAARQAHDTW